LENDKQVCTKTTNKFAENQQTSLHENDKQVCTNSANKFVEIQQTSLSENDSNKELIYKELNNNNKKQELKEEEDANFANSLHTPKVSVSKKSKNWFSAEKVQEIVFGLIQRFYPNQQKGWGDLLNEYFNNVKSAKTKIKQEAGFLKNVSQDAERLLEYCSAAQIQDSAIIAYLDLAEENAWQSLTKWTGEKGENYKTKLKSFELAIQNDAQSGEWNMQDARFANTAYFNYFMEYIYKKYTLGSIRKTRDNQVSQKQQFAVLVSKLSTDLKTFGSDLKDVAARLEKEVRDYNNPHTKPLNGFSKQPKDFDFWLKNKEWEKVELKTPKTATTAPQTPKAEPIYQIPEKAQISENLGLMNITPKYKVLGDAAEKAKAMQGKVFVWNENESKYANAELFRKLSGINQPTLLGAKIFNITDFTNYCVANFGVSVSDAAMLAKELCYLIPEPHQVQISAAEREQFPAIDMSKYAFTSKTA
jgi:hypothetical protein